jgi:hypothetical protein
MQTVEFKLTIQGGVHSEHLNYLSLLSKILCIALAKDDGLFMGVGGGWGRQNLVFKGWCVPVSIIENTSAQL